MRVLVVIVILIGLAAAAGGWYWRAGAQPDVAFRTVAVHRGDLVSTISATGTLEPEEVVDVGAQVAGLIQSFGTDAAGKQVDYRSPVEANMVLANIDDAVYRADVDTARAQLDQARANVAKGTADLATAKARLSQAERNWNRAKDMGSSDALSQNDYDMYKADYETGQAAVAVAEALIAQAKTGIAQAQASLNKAERNLGFCTIKSPVKGVIIDRRVNIGQTVVSSLNAPSLFLIAKDLTRMQIWVAVNEADVGRIAPGTPVTFTCDAFPDRSFDGTVGKVRLNATMAQNVVLYTVEVNTDNSKNVLLPYLTARVQFQVQKIPDVPLVPNAALRWYPTSAAEVAPDARAAWKPIEEQKAPPAPGAPAKVEKKADAAPAERRGTVWVRDGVFVRPLQVKLGATDGTNSQVSADDLPDGTEVVVGEAAAGTQAGAARNPFLPPVIRR